jgi:hypothetical protein
MSARHDHPAQAHGHGAADHEHSDVSLGGIAMTAVGLLAVAIVVQVAMVGLFVVFERQAADRTTPPPSLVTTTPGARPEPRLQANPAQELKALREMQRRRLYGYGWVDEANGVVHIPIDLAMKIMLERGYPVREASTTEPGARALGSSSGRFVPAGER